MVRINFRLIILGILFLCLFSGRVLAERDQRGAMAFRLIDGETGQAIGNYKVTICGETVEFRMVRSKDFRYCQAVKNADPNYFAVEGQAGSDGVLYLERKNFDKFPQDIIFDVESPFRSVSFEKSDGLGHQYNPAYIRVVNADKSTRVISNEFFNLDTNMVKEVTLKGEEKESYFRTIDLVTFKEDNE